MKSQSAELAACFEPEGQARRRRIAASLVFVDAGRPGHLVLPVLAL